MYLSLSPGRGGRDGIFCDGGVENVSLWWPRIAPEVVILCCYCYLTPKLENDSWTTDGGCRRGEEVVSAEGVVLGD